jgi:hemerythrin-like domain-containing protein
MFFGLLQNKTLSDKHKKTIDKLTEEHEKLRLLVSEIEELTDTYRKGEKSILQQLTNTLQKLSLEYSNHFDKENEQFFSTIIDEYLTKEEKTRLQEEFNEFDRTRIHEKYDQVIDHIQKM